MGAFLLVTWGGKTDTGCGADHPLSCEPKLNKKEKKNAFLRQERNTEGGLLFLPSLLNSESTHKTVAAGLERRGDKVAV